MRMLRGIRFLSWTRTGRVPTMTAKLKSVLVLVGFFAFVVILIYLGLRNPRETLAESCGRQCHPKQGVVERLGPTLGPEWRPSPRNLVCVCR